MTKNSFDHSDDENGLNAEDLKFFKKRAKFLGSFADTDLLSVEKKAPGKKDLRKKKVPGALDALEEAEDSQATVLKKMQNELQRKRSKELEEDEESEEDEFDRLAKKVVKKDTEGEEQKQLGLPVRSSSGEWKRQAVTIKPQAIPKSDKKDSESDEENTITAASSSSVNMTKDAASTVTLSFEEAKEKMALIAMEITEDIDENVGKLKDLLKFTRLGVISAANREEEVELMRMGLITTLAVFKDILPGYSIRPLTEAEKQVKVSKEIRKQRNFEETLLKSYSQYVNRLEEVLKTVKKGDSAVVPVAVGCLGELASSAGHFNYYEQVLSSLCNQVFNGKEHISSVAVSSLGKVFAEDQIGRSTAHALRLLSDSIQAKDYLPEESALKVLSQVRMNVLAYSRTDALPSEKRIASEEAARLDAYKKKAGHLSKSQKKTLKAELAESIKTARAEAEFTREERSKWSTDALKFLFRILFGILKRFTRGDEATSLKTKAVSLLPEVMKCLSKCSQFLSVEYFSDLLSTLRKAVSLIEREQSMEATLHTVQTVLQIAFLQESSKIDLSRGSAASVAALTDLKFYFDLIYRSLQPQGNNGTALRLPKWNKSFESLFDSVMTKLFLSKKHVPVARVAAFIHRFANLIPAVEFEAQIYFLRLIIRLMDRHEKCRGLLDEDTLGVAAYLPACPDPDLCNPFCKRLDLDSITSKIQGGKVPNDLLNQIRRIKSIQ